MPFLFILIVACSLAMDAFAVSVGLGIKHPNYRTAYALKVAFMFGFFQAVMPLIGWFLGAQFRVVIAAYDHWIIFIILGAIGIKMIYEAVKGSENSKCINYESFRLLLLLSLATSIDALAVGFSFAFLHSSIFIPALIIGLVTFVISFIGAALGDRIGSKFKVSAEIIGGSVLFLIGLNILLKHLSIY